MPSSEVVIAPIEEETLFFTREMQARAAAGRSGGCAQGAYNLWPASIRVPALVLMFLRTYSGGRKHSPPRSTHGSTVWLAFGEAAVPSEGCGGPMLPSDHHWCVWMGRIRGLGPGINLGANKGRSPSGIGAR